MVQVPNRAYSTQDTLLIESHQRKINYENILRTATLFVFFHRICHQIYKRTQHFSTPFFQAIQD